MINLSDELDNYAARGAEGAQERLANPEVRAALRARVARARRRANAIIAVVAVAVLGMGASAWAAPRDTAPPIQPAPSPSIATAAPDDQLPTLDSVNYLTEMHGAYRTSEALICDIISIAPMVPAEYPYPGSIPPLPTWIEADRIYGLPDELPPNYPIPLYSREGNSNFGLALKEIPQLYPKDAQIVVALIAEDGSWWGFDARYQVIYAMPFDSPGIFVSLTPNEDCKGGPRAVDRSRIPPGHYDARIMVNRTDITYGNVIKDFGDVEIVTGLPSVPYLNVTK
jgi:hypothetical protein